MGPPGGMGEPGRKKWLVLALVALGVFLVVMDVTVVNVALPLIREDLGYLDVTVADLQWVVNAYSLSFAVLMLAGGKLADLFGRRLMFMIGLTVFALASLGAGLAESIDVLILFRALQGAGAALVMPASLSIVALAFPPWERGTAIGIWSALVGTGVAIGPLVGGVLSEELVWRWVFYVNVPFCVLAIICSAIWISESRAPIEHRQFDAVGVLLSGAALFCLVFGLQKANDYDWGDPRTLGLFAGAVAAAAAFIAYERRVKTPMLDLSLFRSATFSGANVTSLLGGFVLIGALFYLNLFTQNIMGYTAIEAGAVLLPMTALSVIASPIAGRLTDRYGPRWILTAGMVLLGLSLASFAPLDFDSDIWDLAPGLVVAGIGFAFVLTPITTAALTGVPLRQAGVGSAVVNTARQAGGALGLAVMGAVSAHIVADALSEGKTGPEGFVDGFAPVMFIGVGAAALGAVISAGTIARKAPAAVPVAAPAAPPGVPAPAQPSLIGRVSWAVPAPEAGQSLVALARQAALVGPEAAPAVAAPPGPARLEVTEGPAAGTQIAIGLEPMVFGRAEEGKGKLGDDSELSRRHARISQQDGKLLVEDLGSTNGTLVNGREISEPATVGLGEVIELGTSKLRVAELPMPAPAVPAAAAAAAAAAAGPAAGPQVTRVTAAVAPELEVVDGPAAGTRIPVGETPFVFGRAEEDRGKLGDDPELSRRHASASLIDPARILIEDLGSTNGTYVNDLRIGAPTIVRLGDSVRLGTTTLKVVAPRSAEAPSDMARAESEVSS
jgi:EmrB/QacA subfamily drug resistance transporter